MSKDEKRAKELAKIYGISLKEAMDLVEDDKAVDRGEPLPWDLTEEELKNQKEVLKLGGGKIKKEKKPREKKENPEKQELFNWLCENLPGSIEIVEDGRKIQLVKDGKTFEITLVQKREKKA